MLKSTKVYLAALSMVSTMALVSQPAFAQMESDDSSDMGEIDIVLNLPDALPTGEGIPDFSSSAPSGGGEIAFSLPLPNPGDVVAAMRGGSGGWGRGPCPVGARGRGGCPLNMLEGENAVTSEQYEKLYSLKNSVLDARGPKMLELMTAKRHLRDELTRESIDEKAVKKLQNQIASAKSELTNLEMDSKLQMMQILTGAQRKELRKAMVEGPKRGGASPFHQMMRKMMEKGPGPGHGGAN
ncbi:Spy/CpxP family protein refolding chaperone [Candidatus Obscuribacterales bacterium]|nr:Spy/CpxP family protein refolding chaperone [Candidatus Obscuribacterales bacterium]MBX3148716.1 Spy/CpxP family protein refolding chaperone [Candidatus Obscuribacterales bacterium]